ncbi:MULTISPECIES: hypothetical protein [Xanthomonas]|uniref:Chloroperoxidase n=5 Tax=Xanthomonas TaxID=338 RepID=A0AAX0I5A3_XANCG|nr:MULTISPECIES: hypothetical protein [Xanthomonas]ASY89127.1 chloroperoxidase [Xanthomonas citri pv. malvacearum]EKQ58561.1 non-heme chloroperoxidase [Xanthomonas citri pv. malvacearum str. GSPB1386]AOY63313.1 chloroperoxidase [Xanthomonas citri pv. glycines str. 8ra]ARV22869.1 chloroperoxidase [Xanthomonas citri pv. glycines str. 12-2]OEY98737.1 chloroperoxidase [Xanthomonas citri pv. glycines]
MDKARDRRSDQDYTAQQVADLDPSARRALKPHLRCPYCEATAHFRSASRPSPGRRGKVAHFYALPHGDDCDITRSYGDPSEDDDQTFRSTSLTSLIKGAKIIVYAGAPQGLTETYKDRVNQDLLTFISK